MNKATLTADSKEEHISFVDKIVYAYLPEKQKHPQLNDLVRLYQLHRHFKSCHKHKKQVCRFSLVICLPLIILLSYFWSLLLETMSENEKYLLLHKRSDILLYLKF